MPREPSQPLPSSPSRSASRQGGGPPAEPPPPEKRSILRLLFRLLASLVLILILVLGGLAAALTYLFPAEEMLPIAEDQLTRRLGMPVRIGQLGFNLLTGLELRQVRLGEGDPAFQVDEIILAYDLKELLDGGLTIHRIRVLRPRLNLVSTKGVWNIQPLLDLAGPPSPRRERPREPAPGLELPVPVSLTELSVEDIEFNARVDDSLSAHLSGLTLRARGKVDAQGLDLQLRVLMQPPSGQTTNLRYFLRQNPSLTFRTGMKTDLTLTARDLHRVLIQGTIQFQETFARRGRVLPAPDLRLALSAVVDRQTGLLNLPRFLLELGEKNRLEAAAQVKGFLGPDPSFSLRLPSGRLDLQELTRLARGFLPPLSLKGQVLLTDWQLEGRLKAGQPERLTLRRAGVTLTNGLLRHPPTRTRVRGMQMDLEVTDLKIQGRVPRHANVEWSFKAEEGQSGNISFQQLTESLSLVGTGPRLEQADLRMLTQVKSLRLEAPDIGAFQSPVFLRAAVRGNVRTGDVETLKTTLKVGPLEQTLSAVVRGFGKQGFEVTEVTRLDFQRAREWLTPDLIERFGVGPLSGHGELTFQGTGRLDPEGRPAELAGKVRGSLAGFNASFTKPALVLDRLDAGFEFPLEWRPGRGVRVADSRWTAALEGLKALDRYQMGPTRIGLRLRQDQWIPLEAPRSGLKPALELSVQNEWVQSTEPELRLAGLKMQLDSGLEWDAGQGPRNLHGTGGVEFQEMQALGQVSTGAVQSEFSVRLADLSLENLETRLKTRLARPVLKHEGLELAFDALSLEADSRQNLQSGDIQLDRLVLVLPGLMRWSAQGTLGQWGERFDVKSRLDRVNLKPLLARVPASFKAPIRGLALSGSAAWDLEARGLRPEAAAFRKADLPLTVRTRLDLKGVDIDWPEKQLLMRGLDFQTTLGLKDNALDLAGRLTLAHLKKADLEQKLDLAPEWTFHYQVHQWDRVEILEQALSLPGQTVRHALSGRIEGLRPFLTGKQEATLAGLLKTLDLALATELDADLAPLAPLAPGLTAEGRATSRLDLTLVAGKQLELQGELGFHQIHVRHESGTEVRGLNGRFPLNKKLLLDRLLLKNGSGGFAAARRGFFNQLREFSRYKNILRVQEVRLGEHALSDLAMNVYYQDNRLFLERFLMNLLGGSVAGHLFLTQTERGPELQFSTEFAHLDFNRLVKKKVAPAGRDSEVDGNMTFSFKVTQGGAGERISIDQIGARVNITHIGREVLDRILLFFDPEESKPAIVDIRAKLDLATPENLSLRVENGNLSLDVGLILLGSRVPAPALRRVPITSLKHFRQISGQLQKLSEFQNVLQYLAANGVEFDDAGNPVFF